MDNEVWKPAVGFEGLYEVSSEGRVRSLDTHLKGGGIRLGRVMALRTDRRGYPRLNLVDPSSSPRRMRRGVYVHQLVARAFLGNPHEGAGDVNHIDFNPSNNKVSNLEWASRRENLLHSSRAGRFSRSREPRKTYTTQQINQVRDLLSVSVSPREVSTLTGVGIHSVWALARGRSHVVPHIT